MNYIKLTKFDTSNGPGIRTVLWVAGCDNHCPGCHNPETWDPNAGTPFRTTVVDEIDESLSHPYIAGLTVSGGDPFYSENITAVTGILSYIKKKHPDKTIWVYTGYSYENLKDLPIMEYIDVLVDGRFILALKDITLPYSGSSNQRIIDIPKSRETGEVIRWQNTNMMNAVTSVDSI